MQARSCVASFASSAVATDELGRNRSQRRQHDRESGRDQGHQRERDDRAAGGGDASFHRLQQADQEHQERGREDRVEAERLGVTEHRPEDRADHGPRVPAREHREPGGPERTPAVCGIGLGQCHRGRLVDEELGRSQSASRGTREDAVEREPVADVAQPEQEPLPIADNGDPPDAITPTAANCVAPVNTNNENAHAIGIERPALVAITPNEIPNTPTATPSAREVRRMDGRRAIAQPPAMRATPARASASPTSWYRRSRSCRTTRASRTVDAG